MVMLFPSIVVDAWKQELFFAHYTDGWGIGRTCHLGSLHRSGGDVCTGVRLPALLPVQL